MKKKLYLLFLLMSVSIPSCFAQQTNGTNLFEWSNGNVIPKLSYIEEDDQPSENELSSVGYTPNLYHSYLVRSSNNIYTCHVQIMGQQGVNESDDHCYEQFTIVDSNGSRIFRRFGECGPLTTTQWLSSDYNDNNYFRKIPLDGNSYALIFAGWFFGYDDLLGEMIIIVVSKNVVTLVYDGRAAAVSPTDFDSNNFSMDFVKDGTGLTDPNTGLLEITPAKLVGRTKYRLYKDGNMLKIVQWE